MKVKDAIRFIIDSITEIYGPGESESIAFLVLDFIGYPRKLNFLRKEDEIGKTNEEFIRQTVAELLLYRPVQYILGETEFFGLKFRLNEFVLIPRQETEQLVHLIIQDNKKKDPAILDLGTGSGCIAISLAKNIPFANVLATDISKPALEIARINSLLNKTEIGLTKDDIFKCRIDKNRKFDIIVSNPPYVLHSEKRLMHDNVLKYEPALALFVNDDNPLLYYKAIAAVAFEKLQKNGNLYVEINENYGIEVADLMLKHGLSDPVIIKDIPGKNRFVKAVKS